MADNCKCIDCGGDQPGHSNDCEYMRELHGEPVHACPVCLTATCADCNPEPLDD